MANGDGMGQCGFADDIQRLRSRPTEASISGTRKTQRDDRPCTSR
jgi:hypothetical protein